MSRAAIERGTRNALCAAAQEAYDKFPAVSPYLASSDMDTAWRTGRWMAETGRSRPMENTVWPGRGATFHINGMLIGFTAKTIVRLK